MSPYCHEMLKLHLIFHMSLNEMHSPLLYCFIKYLINSDKLRHRLPCAAMNEFCPFSFCNLET